MNAVTVNRVIEALALLGYTENPSAGGVPAGTGSEIQIRASASAFGAITGSSWNGTTLTVPNISVTGAVNLSPANAAVTLSPSGTGIVTIAPATVGSMDNVVIGATTRAAVSVTTLNANAQITSTLATGTAPLVVASTTVVANLNVSSLNGATFAAPGAIGGTTPAAGAFTTVSVTAQITSTLATGTAPFVIASTTAVTNLNASLLLGGTWASPGSIGATAAGTGAFTTLSASSTVSGAGFSTYLASPPAIGGTAAGAITGTTIQAASANGFQISTDVILTRAAAANLRHGAVDAAAPVAQTISVQSVAPGTSNTAGALWTLAGSAGTGTGTPGGFAWQLAPAGTTGTAQNAQATAMTLTQTGTGPILTVGSGTTTASGLQIAYGGTTGWAGLWPTNATVGLGNAYFMATNNGSSVILSSAGNTGVTISIRPGASNVATVGIDITTGVINPNVDGAFTVGKSANRFSAVFLGSATAITASAPAIDAVQTWNNGAVVFTAAKINVTNTASAAGSLLQDWQVGGSSKVSIDFQGSLIATGNATLGSGQTFFSSNVGRVGSGGMWQWASTATGSGSADTALARNAAGIVEVNNGTAGIFAAIKASTGTFTAAAPTVSAGQIGFGGTTAATATAGASITIPALAQGYIVINIAGTTAKIPYYNN